MPFEPFPKAGGTRKRFLLGSLLIVALMASATLAVVLLEVGHVKSYFPRATIDKGAITQITAAPPGAAETILIIGSDKRAAAGNRPDRLSPPHSDTLLLIRMDPDRHQTSILSIPRDLKTQIVTAEGVAMTTKINAAFSIGGSALVAKAIKGVLPGLAINHIIDIDFKGFRQVIDAIGCVYVFVDRRYFNVNLHTAATNYANIDISPGYQKLCGQQALDYARYRHSDSDYVRVARQQDFIRQAKQQVGVQNLFNHQDQLLKAVRNAVHTDIHGDAVVRLINLGLFSLGRPVRQVAFQSTPGPSYVTATPEQDAGTVNDFLNADPGPIHVAAPLRVPAAPARTLAGRGHSLGAGLGLIATPAADLSLEHSAARSAALTVYAPRLRAAQANAADVVRTYLLADEQGNPHQAYVISIARGLVGEFYGLEGTDWMTPPILSGAHQTRRIGGLSYDLYVDGGHIRLVAWRTPGAVYWLSNTVRDSLTNQQLLAIAQSARPVS